MRGEVTRRGIKMQRELADLRDGDATALRLGKGNQDIRLAFGQIDPMRCGDQFDPDRRRLPIQRFEARRQIQTAKRFHRRHANNAARCVRCVTEIGGDGMRVRLHAFRMRQQAMAGIGQKKPEPGPFEQFLVQRVFECAQPAADRRMVDAEMPGRFGQALELGDGEENLYVRPVKLLRLGHSG